jgi:hypothetical protein
MRLKKMTRAKKPRRASGWTFAPLTKRFTRVRKAVRAAPQITVATVAAVAICVALGAMLAAALQAGAGADAGRTVSRTPPRQATPDSPVRQTVRDATPPGAGGASTSNTPAAQSAVSITGCLERHQETFRLRNTTGVQAPKVRSWKSGFLKKNAAAIQLVGAANGVELPQHVGERVVVTGTLVDREMRVRSLRRVSSSCDQDA